MEKLSIQRQGGHAVISLLLVIAILAFMLVVAISSFFVSYSNLTEEVPVAELRFKQEGEMVYTAYLKASSDSPDEAVYTVKGDQWRLDARFLKMRWLFSAFGKEPRYALSRLEGRYSSAEDANNKQHFVNDLDEGGTLEFFSIFGFNLFADISYGTSVYQNIETDKLYKIYRTTTGLIVRQSSLTASDKEKGAWDKIKGWWSTFT
ncbi:hypothetical protein M1D97_00675 [Kushneria sp. AK178]